MANLTVSSGQSLWSIAKSRLPNGAPDVDVAKAARQIADANGLPANAPLSVGQSLVVPDAFVGVSSGGAASDAMARLSTTTTNRAGSLSTRLGATAKPLLQFDHALVDTPKKRVGDLALPSIAGQSVNGSVHVFEGVKSSIDPAAFRTVDGSLGKLSKQAFDDVHAALGGRSPVTFDADRSYSVRDFLPAALQALVDKDLDMGDPVELKGTRAMLDALGDDGMMVSPDGDLKIHLTMNCHAAAYEAVRAYQGNEGEVALFYGEMITMDGLVEGGEVFEKVGGVSLAEIEAGQIDKLLALDLKPGDVVQFHEESEWARMTMLLHSAVYVGGGLFFEKPNTEGPEKEDPANYVKQDETPFRLATLDDMQKPIAGFVDGKFRVEVVRAKKQLEDPAQAFGSSQQENVAAWAEKKGRTLGAELVVELEQGSGGGIRAEHASALVRAKLAVDAQGNVKIG